MLFRSGGQRFHLLPLLSRSDGRKAFISLGVSGDGEHVRVFKYSWYKNGDGWRELRLLRRLRDVPGVVHLDDELKEACIESNLQDGTVHKINSRTRGVLALKTIGYPLCACESVLEFLEAMYDLLEGKWRRAAPFGLVLILFQVLRFLVQEKGILHRDVSWSNVLIHPREIGNGSTRPQKDVNKPRKDKGKAIPHTYRFISDIFQEDEYVKQVLLSGSD